MLKIDPEQQKKAAKEKTRLWLKDVYKKELGREYDEPGAKYWTADIHDRGQTQEQVLANIRRSDEYKAYQRGKGQTPPPIVKPPIHGDPGPKPKPEKPKYDYTPDPDRKYNKYWDAIDAAANTGNQMTDEYYGRFIPRIRK